MSGDARIVSAYLSGPIQRETFPRSARLLRHADFEQVYKRGKRHFSALMTVFFLPRERTGGCGSVSPSARFLAEQLSATG